MAFFFLIANNFALLSWLFYLPFYFEDKQRPLSTTVTARQSCNTWRMNKMQDTRTNKVQDTTNGQARRVPDWQDNNTRRQRTVQNWQATNRWADDRWRRVADGRNSNEQRRRMGETTTFTLLFLCNRCLFHFALFYYSFCFTVLLFPLPHYGFHKKAAKRNVFE